MEGSCSECLRRTALGPEAHARIADDKPTDSLVVGAEFSLALRRLLNPDDEVVQGAAQNSLDSLKQGFGVGAARSDGHHALRHRETPTRFRLPEAVVRDELRNLGALQFEARCFGAARRRPRTLMPTHRIARRNQNAAAGIGPVSELGVLTTPLGE